MRAAPAIPIIERLLRAGAQVRAYDPAAAPVARRRLSDTHIALCDRSYDALAGADAFAIVTEWNEFREPDFDKMRALLKSPVVFDGRNIYSPEQMRALASPIFPLNAKRVLMTGDAVRFYQGEVTDLAAFRTALRRHDIGAIMHFAAFLDVTESVREPVRYLPQQCRARAIRHLTAAAT
jgi:nucleoside-diphosphate-sugar epimerase